MLVTPETNPNFTVAVKNASLNVNGKRLEYPMDHPEQLKDIIDIGRTAIYGGIEDAYWLARFQMPDHTISRPPIKIMRFGINSQRKRILTKIGQDNLTNIHTDIDELKPPYHSYWEPIAQSGHFNPEVRSGFTGPEVGGIWLFLKTNANYVPPQKPDQLNFWGYYPIANLIESLEFEETPELITLKLAILSETSPETRQQLMDRYHASGQNLIDMLDGVDYTKAQIGLMLTIANIRRLYGDTQGAELDIEDAIYSTNQLRHNDQLRIFLDSAREGIYSIMDEEF